MPHFKTDFYCPQTRRFPAGDPWVAGAAVLASVSVLASAAVLPNPISSNLEGRMKTVTGTTGSSAVITCDLPGENTRHIHWYLHQEGKAPQRLLYCDTYNSRVMLDSDSEKKVVQVPNQKLPGRMSPWQRPYLPKSNSAGSLLSWLSSAEDLLSAATGGRWRTGLNREAGAPLQVLPGTTPSGRKAWESPKTHPQSLPSACGSGRPAPLTVLGITSLAPFLPRPQIGRHGWALALLLAFLPPASQISSNLEGRMKSVTGTTGSSAVITCDLPGENTLYIHWYLHQEGKAPQHLLYCDTYNARVMLDSGVSPGKLDSYAIMRSSKLIVQNLNENDSRVYYFATWDRHSGSDLPTPH
ncbi:uncharacterized protein LOC116546761 [Sapajus apella]|uniref:Uncharacterized protein LOC116546761 n=1 Tax=Sapajus apella TaxID=9515 RepID=A0A6J3HF80_SAPAP|nr:uncharacterized protein LOC116546761 [Sapajus apella]